MIRFVLLPALLAAVALTGSAHGEVLATLRLQTVDPVTQLPIDSVELGETFTLQAIVLDVRVDPFLPSVFSGAVDITFDPNLAAPSGPIEFDDFFPLLRHATILPGYLQNVSATSTSLMPPGQVDQLLFSLPFQANQVGELEFHTAWSTDPLDYEWLMYGHEGVILADQVELTGTSIAVVPEPSSVLLLAAAVLGFSGYASRRRRQKMQGFAARC